MNGTSGPTDLLITYQHRLNKSQVGHYIAFERYARQHRVLTVLTIGLSGITSALLLFDYNATDGGHLDVLILALSILASVITALLAFLSLDVKADLHKTRATKYGALRRSIEVFLAGDRADVAAFLAQVELQWNYIADDSPVTPRRDRSRAREVIEEDHSDIEQFSQPPNFPRE